MASRRKATRQQNSSSNDSRNQAGAEGPNRELLQQYTAGKKFRVKYLGSHDIEDYRNKRETSTVMSDLKKRSAKAPKPKAIISLYLKELIVMDEKSKAVTMKVPVQKVKFVCHDKHDTSLFGVILATDRVTSESQRLHRLFCYQADQKIATSFVRSMNELFQLLGEIMRERRRQNEATNSSSAAEGVAVGGAGAAGGRVSTAESGGGASAASGHTSQSQSGSDQQKRSSNGGEHNMSDDEMYEPVPLGFGIEAAPPSYKAAISKKNESIFMKPDDIVTTVNTLLPPPPVQSRPKKPAASLPSASSRTRGPSLPGPPPSTGSSVPSVAPPRPRARTRHTSQEHPALAPELALSPVALISSPAGTTQIATPTSQVSPPTSRVSPPSASATSLPLPQIPVGAESSASGDGGVGGVMFSVGRAGNGQEQDLGFDPSAEGNIYDVPTSNVAAPTNQEQRQVVWQEWQALESELQSIAQDLGFDMDNGSVALDSIPSTLPTLPAIEELSIASPDIISETGFDVNQSLSSTIAEDPFADDFFQTSFGSSTTSIMMQPAWPDSVSSIEQVEMPFDVNSGFETSWGAPVMNQASGTSVSSDPFQESVTTPTSSQAATSVATDPFQESVTTPTSSQAVTSIAADPFQDSTPTPSSASASLDFAGFSAQSAWSESITTTVTATTTTLAQEVAPTSTFEGSFAADWSAFDVSMNTVTSSSSTLAQHPMERESPSGSILSPPPDVTSSATIQTEAIPAQEPPSTCTSEGMVGTVSSTVPTTTSSISMPAIPQPPPKRDQAVLLPPPVSPIRRADTIFGHNQSTSTSSSTSSRSRPRPSAEHTQGTTTGQVILNRPAKSKSSTPSRSSGGDVDVQLSPLHVPTPDLGTGTDTLDSSFETSGSGSQTESTIPATSVTAPSDPFQTALSPSPGSASTTSQANVSDLFQDSQPLPAIPLVQSTTSETVAVISDPFQNGSHTQETADLTGQGNIGDSFLVGLPSAAGLITSSQPIVSNPFLDAFPSVTSSVSAKALSVDPFQDGFTSSGAASPISKSTSTVDNPFLDSVPSATTVRQSSTGSGDLFQSSTATDSQTGAISAGQSTTTSVSKSIVKDAGGDAWLAFGDILGSKQEEASSTGFSAFDGAGVADKEAPTKEQPTGWSAFNSTPSQKQEKQTSPFPGFEDDWGGSPNTENVASSESQPAISSDVKTTAPAVATPGSSQSTTESSSWAAFDLGAISAPSTSSKQSQPLQRSAQPAVAGLLPPPSKSSLGSSKPKASRSRPRGRPTTGGSVGRGGVINLNPPASSQSKQSSSPSQPSSSSASSASKPMLASTSNPLNKVEISTKKSGCYIDELSSLSMQPQLPPMNINYQAGGGPAFHQQPHDLWGSPSIVSQPTFPTQQQQPPVNIPYGPPQGGGQGIPLQQQNQQQQQQQFVQQQAMFMQQQRAMQMHQGPHMPIQQGPRPMLQGPGVMQQGSGPMQGLGPMQQVPGLIQQEPGPMQMQQFPMGTQFSPVGLQMMDPPGGGGQMQPAHFSTPQQRQNFYPQQQQLQQNPNTFSPIAQHQNPLSSPPGNASLSVTGGSNLSTSNLYTSDFSSPPYAVGSSTPQSSIASPPSEPLPKTVEYRPTVSDSRLDPFASLVSGALSPSKDGKVKGMDAQKLKAAFIKQPSPNRGFPAPGSTYGNSAQSGWV